MQTLSDHTIKKSAIVFLKNYYKQRPKISATIAMLDLKTPEGIIADGRLSFIEKEGKEFVATFEATSLDSQEEIIYTENKGILFWDSLAITANFIALIYLIGKGTSYFSVLDFGKYAGLIGLVVFGMAFFYFIRTLLFSRSRYRYIYAIEQFKQYYADDQWIVIADNIFDGPDNPALLELKKQCVKNGIGLLEVGKDKKVIPIITAAREEVILKRRKSFTILPQSGAIQSYNTKIKSGLSKIWSMLYPDRFISSSINRYKQFNINQVILSFIGLGIIAYFVYNEYQQLGPELINKVEYEKEMENLTKTSKPETPIYLVDSIGEVPFNAPYEPIKIIDPTSVAAEAMPITQPVEELILSDGENGLVRYNCERFYNFKGNLFLVQVALESDLSQAEAKLFNLKEQNYSANLISLSCFLGNSSDYVVYLDEMFPTKEQALNKAKYYLEKFNKTKYAAQIAVRKLSK